MDNSLFRIVLFIDVLLAVNQMTTCQEVVPSLSSDFSKGGVALKIKTNADPTEEKLKELEAIVEKLEAWKKKRQQEAGASKSEPAATSSVQEVDGIDQSDYDPLKERMDALTRKFEAVTDGPLTKTSDMLDETEEKYEMILEKVKQLQQLLESETKPAQKQVASKADCLPGELQSEESCYVFSSFSTTWPAASVLCRSLGGSLARVDTDEEHSLLVKQLNKRRHTGSCLFLNAHDLVKRNVFRWADDQSVANGKGRFVSGEPNRADENCLTYWSGHGSYGWNDAGCRNYVFICEIPR